MIVTVQPFLGRRAVALLLLTPLLAAPRPLLAQPAAPAAAPAGGEANLVLPDLSAVDFHGVNGRTLLMSGLLICALGLGFGLMTVTQLKNLPVHESMREVSELIYETCKTYLTTQGRFILLLWA